MKLTLAENIRTFRKERALTQEQLSEAMGVTVGAVHKWESGASVPELGMIVELADFFDTSVDVLLGYHVKDNRLATTAKRLSAYCKSKDPEALVEAEKALKKYPHSFEVVHSCAKVYLVFSAGQPDKKRQLRALELLEQARLLIAQNTDPEISEATLYGEMASAYVMMGEQEKGTELLKRHNAHGLYSASIGMSLAVFLKRPEEADPFLTEALLHSVSNLLEIVVGYVFLFCSRGSFASALEIIRWGIAFLHSVKKEEPTCFLDQMHVVLTALLAHVQLKAGMEEACESARQADELARRFDAAPNYGAEGLRFASVSEDLSIHDSLGRTAAESVETLLRYLNDAETTKLWKEVTNHA